MKLSQQLQESESAERQTRTERVAKQQQSLRDQKEAERQARIEAEVDDFGENADYENYEEKYNQLSDDAKKRVLSPDELKKTDGYKKYAEEKAEYERQLAIYNEAQAYNYDLEVATKFWRKGLSPSMLGNKRQKEMWRELEQNRILYEQKLLYPEKYSTLLDVYKKNPELLQSVISGDIKPVVTTIYGNTKVEFQQTTPTKEEQYKSWQEESGDPLETITAIEKKSTIIDRGISKVKSFFTGWSLDVTGTSYPKLTISKKQEGDAGQELANAIVSEGYSTIKSGYEKIPDLDIYIKQPSIKNLFVGGGGITLTPLDTDIKLSDVKQAGVDYLAGVQDTTYQKDLEKIGISEIETQAQEEYQKRFEDKYMKKIIYEEMTFDEASAEFEQSDEAKQLQKNYENTVANELMDLGFTKQGWIQAGAGIGSSVLSLVPTTAKSTVVTGAGIYAGYSALKLIPSAVALTGTGVIGAYGGYKAFSPTSTPTERAGGLITLGIAGLTLGYSAYKYLRRPVISTEKIKVPVKEITNKKVIGIEDPTKRIIKVGGKTYAIDKTLFPKQKLSTQVIEGRRTIVTSQFRSLLNKYLDLNIKPIYEGIPYVDAKGYATALKRLTNYGYSTSQAKSVLRYYQPKVIETTLSKGIIKTTTIDDLMSAKGDFEIVTEQPKINIDEKLGISTRYAKTKIDYYDFERSVIKSVSGKDLIYTDILKTSPYAKLGKKMTRFEEYSIVESGDLQEGVIKIGEGDGFDILKEAKYQDLKSLFAQKQYMPLKRQINFGEGETRIVKVGEPKVVEYDIDELMGVSYGKSNFLSPANIEKTPFAKTFATQEIKKIISGKSIKQPTIKDVEKVLEKLEKGSTPSASASQSQYYGTGQYERTVGGLLPKETFAYMKDLPIPALQQQVGIKDLILMKQSDILALDIGALTGLKIQSALKTDQLIKSDLKVDTTLKDLVKTKTDIGIKTDVAVQQIPALKTDLALKTTLKSLITNINLGTPTLRTPEIKPPVIRPVTLPPFVLKGLIKDKISKRKKSDLEFAYLPDFTSRVLGLEAETISEKQAQKRLKQLLSGLEIRRAVKIKNVF